MQERLEQYEKQKEYLICVDSDGCAMDTMDIKHIRCFGPCMVKEWGLFEWEEAILTRWNQINLYTVTRGINRFKGLAMALREINDSYIGIEGIETLEHWVKTSDALSNSALQKEIEKQKSCCLQKALSWSEMVNQEINALPFKEKKPFEGVKEALEEIHRYADVAIVSSANLQAVKEEWECYGLLASVDILLAQNVGSKAFGIRELLKKGYETDKVVMIGDSVGDYEAAKKNEVFFYPICVRHEKESWNKVKTEVIKRLREGTYQGKYQEKQVALFFDNLK